MKNFFFTLFLFVFLLKVYADNGQDSIFSKIAQLPLNTLIDKGNVYEKDSKLDTALAYYMLASNKYNSLMDKNEKELCVKGYYHVGSIHEQRGDFSKAMDAYLQGIKICERNDFKFQLPSLYKGVGNVYANFNDYDQAYKYYEDGLRLAKEINDTENQFKILYNLVTIKCGYNQLGEARKFHNEMEKLNLKNNIYKDYYSLLQSGLICLYENKIQESIHWYKKTLQYTNTHRLDLSYKGYIYLALAELCHLTNKSDSALYYLNLSYRIAKKYKIVNMLDQTLTGLTVVCGKAGDTDKVEEYKRQHRELIDSIYNFNAFNRSKNSQIVYEIEKVEKKVADLNEVTKDKKRKIVELQRTVAVISLGLLAFIIAFTIIYRQKKKLFEAYKNLYEKNKEIISISDNHQVKEVEKKEKLLPLESNLETKELSGIDKSGGTNKLSEEQKEKLFEDILAIMANEGEFCDYNFSQKRLAELVKSNTSYVSIVINEKYKKNFSAFVNEYRIREAQRRLSNFKEYGKYTVKDIAESVGYKSQTSFFQLFKTITGITPSIYRKIAEENERKGRI